VQRIWALTAWRVYDFFLLAFTFAHGMNGLRNVLNDYISDPDKQRVVAWGLLVLWAVVSALGAVAILLWLPAAVVMFRNLLIHNFGG